MIENRRSSCRGQRFFRISSGFTLIELMVVIGIFTLIMGVSLSLIIAARNSANISEAQLQVKEYAHTAMERITRDLRLSRSSRVSISNSLGWNPSGIEPNPGTVINFQIPQGSYTSLNLTPNNEIQWGTAENLGDYLAYSVDVNSNLIRSSYSVADASDAINTGATAHISSVTFSRDNVSSVLIHIVITAQAQTSFGSFTQTLRSDVRLRN